ncbi:Uncharacterised protein [Vibrio cholerae]|nr:Uncharacterised protein [Vibrio cholerae]CSB22243.1 Uncharacterised protein [Vibrio cholerae]CSC26378.1 Uncharacterised protein [Vibrio cholerae]CSD17343.1 Uncharacterised protein [Vibrio cholerae]
MVRAETLWSERVTMLAAFLAHYIKAITNLDSFHGVDAHQGMGNIRI